MKKIHLVLALFAITLSTLSFSQERKDVLIDGPNGTLSAVLTTPQLSPGQQLPLVVLMHGFGGNKNGGVIEAMAESLCDKGIASIRFDFDGHGESEGRFVDMTVPKEIEDAIAVIDYVRDLRFVDGIALLGHSQGGVVAAMTAGMLPGGEISDVVLFAPAAVLRDDAIRGSTFGATYNPLDPPQSIKLFGGVELGGDYVRTAFSLPIYETAAHYNGKACVIHGTGDQVVPYTYGKRFADEWGCEYHEIAGEDHGFSKDLEGAVQMATDHILSVFSPTSESFGPRKSLGARGFVTPQPVLIIGSYDAEGNPDAMNAAWGGQSGAKRISICLSSHKSTDNIMAKGEFTVSFADADHVDEADYVGCVSQNTTPDKMERSGLHALKADIVDAPIFEEFPVAIECKVVEMISDGHGGGILTGEIVNLSAREDVLDENGRIDLSKVRPIAFDSEGLYYRQVGEIVGKAFSH